MAEVASRMNEDMLNEQLIAQLLEDDMRALENMRAAEDLQLSEALAKSALAAGRFPRTARWGVAQAGNRDEDAVLEVFKAEVNSNKDALMAQALQHAEDSKMAATARSANSSARLQFGTHLPCPSSHGYCISCLNGYINSKLDPDGKGFGNPNMVVFPIRCPECLLTDWPDGIPDTIAERVLSEKGMTLWHHQKLLDSVPRYYCPNPRCSALVQEDEDSDDPQATCPSCSALICVPCRVVWHKDLTCEEYQSLPLDERSPEDQKALQLMKAQHWRRCPHCSMIVELALGCNHITCRCKTEFCFKCGALWDVPNRRCSRVPSCELWDEELLLEERERQREQEQERQERIGLAYLGPLRLGGARLVIDPPPPPYRPAVHDYNPHYHDNYDDSPDLSWMNDSDVLSTRHWFTVDMIDSLTCQYCQAKLTSLSDLRYHLSHVRRHGVYACCGRFFKREVDLDRHLSSVTRFGYGGHEYTVRRN